MSFTFKGKVMTAIVNEEGLIRNHEYNELASHYINSPVVGDVVIINPQDLKWKRPTKTDWLTIYVNMVASPL